MGFPATLISNSCRGCAKQPISTGYAVRRTQPILWQGPSRIAKEGLRGMRDRTAANELSRGRAQLGPKVLLQPNLDRRWQPSSLCFWRLPHRWDGVVDGLRRMLFCGELDFVLDIPARGTQAGRSEDCPLHHAVPGDFGLEPSAVGFERIEVTPGAPGLSRESVASSSYTWLCYTKHRYRHPLTGRAGRIAG